MKSRYGENISYTKTEIPYTATTLHLPKGRFFITGGVSTKTKLIKPDLYEFDLK